MKKIYLIAPCFFMSLIVFAQDRQTIDRVSGSLLYIYQFEKVQGTSFLKDKWMDASVTVDNGYTFKHVQLKFDVYNNKFIFNRNDSAYELGVYVNAVCFYPNPSDTTQKFFFKKGYIINNTIKAEKYLQVLVEGKISLLKSYQKEIEEYTEYGDANKFKRFNDKENYYLLQDGQYKLVSLNKKSLENVFGSQYNKIEVLLKEKDLSAKDEAGWIAAIKYNNAIK